jgi:hypothetical protein
MTQHVKAEVAAGIMTMTLARAEEKKPRSVGGVCRAA